MYDVTGVNQLLGKHTTGSKSIIYARVSSAKQRADLDRQIDDLQKAYPGHTLISDIASGVNFKRKGLHTILEQVLAGVVVEIVVTHRDRLARIGCDILEFIFEKAGTRLVVHCKDDENDENDLAGDLLAVTTVIVASYNGRISAENRKRRREEKDRERKGERKGRQKKAKIVETASEGEEEL